MNNMLKSYRDITLLPLGIYLDIYKTLVIADLHLGFESFLNSKGIQVLNRSYIKMKAEIEKYLSILDIDRLIINGDLKERILSSSYQENHEIKDLMNFVIEKQISFTLIKGNHDTLIEDLILDNGGSFIRKGLIIGDFYLTHGHIDLREEAKGKNVIIGHEHASILIKDSSSSSHKFNVIAEADFFDKKIFVLPAFSPIKPGCEMNVRDVKFLSPMLKSASSFNYHLFEENEWFSFENRDIII